MLNRDKIGKEIASVATAIFKQRTIPSWLDAAWWQAVVSNPVFIESIKQATNQSCLPIDLLQSIISFKPITTDYAVCGVDGSQIYPDRHLDGVECFLINAGLCFLRYSSTSAALLHSEPKVYVPQHFADRVEAVTFGAELVDLVREEHEFNLLLNMMPQLRERMDSKTPLLALFDGNLLFWHLESKQQDLKEMFMGKYVYALQQLQEQKIPCVGYLSASAFSDVISLVLPALNHCLARKAFPPDMLQHISEMIVFFEGLADAELFAHILKPGQRTGLFVSTMPIVDYYPRALKPCFFYMHAGSEVVRIELAWWMTQSPEMIDFVCGVCLDQVNKGQGYPVALAEAHAQAVVASADREFFYQLLYRLGIRYNKKIMFSQKSLKKKILNV